MIKAIFFDVDGTLLSFKTHSIPQSTFECLQRLKDHGVKVFLATGRGKDGLHVLNDFEFDGYITFNGQCCFTPSESLYDNFISKQQLENIMEYLKEHPFPCGFASGEKKIYNYRDERVEYLHSITHNDGHPVGDLSNITNEKIYQVMAFVDENEEVELMKHLPDCISARWFPTFCDISPKGGSKQLGIDIILKHFGIELSETMAFGDGGNDITMLKHVGVSVAMGNGVPALKEVADYITDDVDHQGIPNAIQHFFGY